MPSVYANFFHPQEISLRNSAMVRQQAAAFMTKKSEQRKKGGMRPSSVRRQGLDYGSRCANPGNAFIRSL